MADAANQPGELLDRSENPVVPQILRGISTLASGIEPSSPSPSLVPGGEGTQVFPPRDETSEASPSTAFILNPIHATNANSTFPVGSSSSSSSDISRASHKSQRSTDSGIDVFAEAGGLTDDEQERVTRFKKGSRRDTYTKRTAPYKRKSGSSMTHQTMTRLAADHAYQKQVAARFFVYHPESNVYSVSKRSGVTFDSGAHLKKGTFVSEDDAMAHISAVIARHTNSQLRL